MCVVQHSCFNLTTRSGIVYMCVCVCVRVCVCVARSTPKTTSSGQLLTHNYILYYDCIAQMRVVGLYEYSNNYNERKSCCARISYYSLFYFAFMFVLRSHSLDLIVIIWFRESNLTDQCVPN